MHELEKVAFILDNQNGATVLSRLFVLQRLAKAKVFGLWWCYGPSLSM